MKVMNVRAYVFLILKNILLVAAQIQMLLAFAPRKIYVVTITKILL